MGIWDQNILFQNSTPVNYDVSETTKGLISYKKKTPNIYSEGPQKASNLQNQK